LPIVFNKRGIEHTLRRGYNTDDDADDGAADDDDEGGSDDRTGTDSDQTEHGCSLRSLTTRVFCPVTHTTVLLLFWNMSGTTRVSRYQKGKTRQVKTNLDLLEQEIVSGSGIC